MFSRKLLELNIHCIRLCLKVSYLHTNYLIPVTHTCTVMCVHKGPCDISPYTRCRSNFHQWMLSGGWWIWTVFQECWKVISKYICAAVPRVHLKWKGNNKSYSIHGICKGMHSTYNILWSFHTVHDT